MCNRSAGVPDVRNAAEPRPCPGRPVRAARPRRPAWACFARVRCAGTGGYHLVCGPGRGVPDGAVRPTRSHQGVTSGWRPVTSDPYTRAVLVTSALFRDQCPKVLRTAWHVCAGSNGCDGRLVRWPNACPSSMLWRRMGPTDTESAARHSSACARVGRRCDGSQVDR